MEFDEVVIWRYGGGVDEEISSRELAIESARNSAARHVAWEMRCSLMGSPPLTTMAACIAVPTFNEIQFNEVLCGRSPLDEQKKK